MKTTSELLKDLRTDRDMTQKSIAAMLGISQQRYSKYESGRHDVPLRVLVMLATYYQVSTDFLLGRTASRRNVDALNARVTPQTTVGQLLDLVGDLSAAGRNRVLDYIAMCYYFEKSEGKWQT